MKRFANWAYAHKEALIACLVILLCALASRANAADTWTVPDTALQVAVTAALYEDYKQTEQIASEPSRYHETNPILGEHPSGGKVRNYFIGSALASAGIAYVLPKPYREAFQAGVLGVEVVAIGHNKHIGLSVRF